MFSGYSSSRNWSMEGYSSDGSTPLVRDTPQFTFDRSSFIDDSELIGLIDSELVIDTNEISGPAINGGPMESPNYQFNQAETSEASFQTEAGWGKSKLTPTQRENKRKCDVNYRQKLKEKMAFLLGLVPGCSKVKRKETMLDEIINYVLSLQRLVEEKASEQIVENKHLKEENKRLNAENTALKVQIGLLPSSGKHPEHQSVSFQDHHESNSEDVGKDHHGTISEAVDQDHAENTALKEQIGLLPSSDKKLEHQSVSLQLTGMGRARCKANLKRGPWSPEEDAALKSYVQTHGTGGNWIAVPLKAGLKRCGKSCRLRWLNYLRPGIKHGGFTEEEDDIICTLYTQMGSRWSLIASQLPGRTDNDVKTYWNTKLKKKLLAGKSTSSNIDNTFTSAAVSLPIVSDVGYGLAVTSTSQSLPLDPVMHFSQPSGPNLDNSHNNIVVASSREGSAGSDFAGDGYVEDKGSVLVDVHHHQQQQFSNEFINGGEIGVPSLADFSHADIKDHHGSNSEAVDKDHHGANSEAVDKDHHGTCSEAVDKEMVLANPTSLMSEGVFSPNATPSQLETVSASKFPGFTSVGLMQGSEDILEVNGVKSAADVEAQLNATEAPRDACLQVQEISLNKRKRNVQDAEIEGQPLNKARKDSTVENQEKGEEESIHIIAQIGQTKTSHSYDVRIETIKEKKRTLQGLVPGCSKLTGAEALDEIINYIQSLQLQVEFLSMKLSAFHPISNGDAAITSNGDAAVTDFLLKLEADDESKVKLSDFVGLDGERILIGKYRFPLSLHPIIKNIIDVYGDVSATSKMNPTIVEAIYIMFCASIKEMSDLRLEKVTEGLILKWRDVIKDALCMNFKVDFAMEHLKKIASAYIGLMEHSKILKLEAQLSAMKEEHSKILERSKVFMDAAEDFNDKPVSSGMFLCARGVKQTLERTSNSSST